MVEASMQPPANITKLHRRKFAKRRNSTFDIIADKWLRNGGHLLRKRAIPADMAL